MWEGVREGASLLSFYDYVSSRCCFCWYQSVSFTVYSRIQKPVPEIKDAMCFNNIDIGAANRTRLNTVDKQDYVSFCHVPNTLRSSFTPCAQFFKVGSVPPFGVGRTSSWGDSRVVLYRNSVSSNQTVERKRRKTNLVMPMLRKVVATTPLKFCSTDTNFYRSCFNY